VVTVLEVHRDHVRLGIEAPRDVEVHRQEVYEAIQQANRLAASSSGGDLSSLGEFLGEKRYNSSKSKETVLHESPSRDNTEGDNAEGDENKAKANDHDVRSSSSTPDLAHSEELGS